jgi:hypothetical protein
MIRIPVSVFFVGGFLLLALIVVSNLSGMYWWEKLIIIMVLLFFGVISWFIVRESLSAKKDTISGQGREKQKPDFTAEPIEWVKLILKDNNREKTSSNQVIFTNYPPEVAVTNGWFADETSYITIAKFEFFRRFPNDERSRQFLSQHPYSEQEILDITTGKVKLEFEKRK